MVTYKSDKRRKIDRLSEESLNNKAWYHDIEVYPNYALFVFKNRETGEYCIIDFDDRDRNELRTFLSNVDVLIGYNCLDYDGQVIEYILKQPGCTVEQIKNFNDSLINSNRKVYYKFSVSYLDLMQVNNYGPYSAKSTSLKHLSFFLRAKNISDSPIDFNDNVKESDKAEIIRYCMDDTDHTADIYKHSLDLIDMRIKLAEKENLNIGEVVNYPEPKLAKEYFLNVMEKISGIPAEVFRNARTYRDKINVKDIILPNIKFKTKEFEEIKRFYEGIKLVASKKSSADPSKSIIVLKDSISKQIEINGTEFEYKAGGLHGCYYRGIYESDDIWVIKDIDYQSFYPKLAIVNKFSPAHIPTDLFVEILESLFQNRLKYDKKTHYSLNYAFKILINIVYGLSNSEFGPFFDSEYTLKTCVNGMLTISMLMEEMILNIPELKILQCNTDGITIMYKRKYENKVLDILVENEKNTGLITETVDFQKMVIYDVNNYLSIDSYGNVKQKGLFKTYDEMLKAKEFHKNPSGNIVAFALNRYYIDNIPVEETINNCNDIYEFLYGEKCSRKFKWIISTVEENGVVKTKIDTSRVLRFFVAGNTTVAKATTDFSRITLANANSPITIAQNIRNNQIDYKEKNNFITLNKQYYIDECNKIIQNL